MSYAEILERLDGCGRTVDAGIKELKELAAYFKRVGAAQESFGRTLSAFGSVSGDYSSFAGAGLDGVLPEYFELKAAEGVLTCSSGKRCIETGKACVAFSEQLAAFSRDYLPVKKQACQEAFQVVSDAQGVLQKVEVCLEKALKEQSALSSQIDTESDAIRKDKIIEKQRAALGRVKALGQEVADLNDDYGSKRICVFEAVTSCCRKLQGVEDSRMRLLQDGFGRLAKVEQDDACAVVESSKRQIAIFQAVKSSGDMLEFVLGSKLVKIVQNSQPSPGNLGRGPAPPVPPDKPRRGGEMGSRGPLPPIPDDGVAVNGSQEPIIDANDLTESQLAVAEALLLAAVDERLVDSETGMIGDDPVLDSKPEVPPQAQALAAQAMAAAIALKTTRRGGSTQSPLDDAGRGEKHRKSGIPEAGEQDRGRQRHLAPPLPAGRPRSPSPAAARRPPAPSKPGGETSPASVKPSPVSTVPNSSPDARPGPAPAPAKPPPLGAKPSPGADATRPGPAPAPAKPPPLGAKPSPAPAGPKPSPGGDAARPGPTRAPSKPPPLGAKPSAGGDAARPGPAPAPAKPPPLGAKPSPAPAGPKPSPGGDAARPGPAPAPAKPPPLGAKPSPAPAGPKPSPAPAGPKPIPAPAGPKPSPGGDAARPGPAPAPAKPRPLGAKPSPAADSARPGPAPAPARTPPLGAKPGPAPAGPKPSPGGDAARPGPAPAPAKPPPLGAKPSPAPAGPKPSPAPAGPKPNPVFDDSRPGLAAEASPTAVLKPARGAPAAPSRLAPSPALEAPGRSAPSPALEAPGRSAPSPGFEAPGRSAPSPGFEAPSRSAHSPQSSVVEPPSRSAPSPAQTVPSPSAPMRAPPTPWLQ